MPNDTGLEGPHACFVLRFWLESAGPDRFWRGSAEEVGLDHQVRVHLQDGESLLAFVDRVLRERSGIGLVADKGVRATGCNPE